MYNYKPTLQLDQFDYDLPKDLIAQFPSQKRDNSKMLVLNKENKSFEHKFFLNIVDLLDENDVLVMNNTKVIPARLIGKKDTGAVIEVFLLKEKSEKIWEALIKPSKRIKPSSIIQVSKEMQVKAIEKVDDKWLVELIYEGGIYDILDKLGNIPLPPYIERNLSDEDLKNLDYERYQTVYAKNPGSVAAPTAGLHFTDEILSQLEEKVVQICYVSLNVGLGPLKPVKC